MLWTPLDETDETRFGSTTREIIGAATVLRALARGRGMVLADAPRTHLAAAVVAADAWMILSCAAGLATAPRTGVRTSQAYFAVLLRASGLGNPEPRVPTEISDRDELIALADGYRRWCEREVGTGAPLALALAATDLGEAGEGSSLSRFGGTLGAMVDGMVALEGDDSGPVGSVAEARAVPRGTPQPV